MINKVKCAITGQLMDENKAYNAGLLRQQLFDLIQKEHPEVTKESYLDPAVVDQYRGKYLTLLINEESGDVDAVVKKVILSIQNNEIISGNLKESDDVKYSYGERLADKIADFGGSWKFIIIFGCFIVVWMIINVVLLVSGPFDPYPFILLNLILSCLAAMQAPVIMMSQNRQETKDRLRAQNDYMVNLKAELEIKMLHEKIDHLMVSQHTRLLEIQQIQMDYLKDILEQLEKKH